MNVWVVQQDVHYEGMELIAVASTQEKAKQAAYSFLRKEYPHFLEESSEVLRSSTGVFNIDFGHFNLVVERHKVI